MASIRKKGRSFEVRIKVSGVLHSDCLAKYAAAFFRMSRSSVVRLSSAFNRLSSACID